MESSSKKWSFDVSIRWTLDKWLCQNRAARLSLLQPSLSRSIASSLRIYEVCALKRRCFSLVRALSQEVTIQTLCDGFPCGLLCCTLLASVLKDHSGYALVPYKKWPLVYNPYTKCHCIIYTFLGGYICVEWFSSMTMAWKLISSMCNIQPTFIFET